VNCGWGSGRELKGPKTSLTGDGRRLPRGTIIPTTESSRFGENELQRLVIEDEHGVLAENLGWWPLEANASTRLSDTAA
jgi:hypothetical protein